MGKGATGYIIGFFLAALINTIINPTYVIGSFLTAAVLSYLVYRK